MSENQPLDPRNQPPQNPRDARAQAKADKAYAKARRPWYKKKRFILPLALIVLIVIISIATMSGGGGNDTADPDSSSDPTATETSEPAFPGAQDSDVIGQAGDPLVLGDITVTSTALSPGDSTLGPTLCTTATIQNGSDETIDFNAFDWKLQAPSGTISNAGVTGSSNILAGGQVAPSGTATGDVCFDNAAAESGKYIVLYEPIFSFFSDRGAWINTV
ncbi:DUF4352 domain-containing protein [Arthrobacter zhaoxinii]|uniref:DUF4352 domain-containing protein n=1 Tax=Arthrobacter zhaoxinii TaxID=2964616 RepID=A0ABY5YVT8_9MICC|nr:DUF4352 domain-containing protein [Arthrobacter zhaoxinii]UWX97755.1 DUF4352 domain-containing protein [Arthrobacter zhaoxinii]